VKLKVTCYDAKVKLLVREFEGDEL